MAETQQARETKLVAALKEIVAAEKERLNSVVDNLIAGVKVVKPKSKARARKADDDSGIGGAFSLEAILKYIEDVIDAQQVVGTPESVATGKEGTQTPAARHEAEIDISDLIDSLDELVQDLLDAGQYEAAAQLGTYAANPELTIGDQAATWIGHTQKYAKLVPKRIADALKEVVDDPDFRAKTADEMAAALTDKIETFRHAVTRYSQPPYGTGMQAYGDALDASDVMVNWTLGEDEDHCDVCPDLAEGSPYAKGELPTWPKAGDTPCLATPESRVLTHRGPVPIRAVIVGDLVLTHRNRWRPVLSTQRFIEERGSKLIEITAPNGSIIGCTDNHEWLTERGWLEAQDIPGVNAKIRANAEILDLFMREAEGPACGELPGIEVQALSALSGENPQVLLTDVCLNGTTLYDITVAEDHSFIVEGLISHNCFDNCYCTITADPVTWALAFPTRAYSEEEAA